VDGSLVDVQGGFVDSLGQRWVGMDDPGQVFAGALEFHCDHAFGDQLRGIGAENMDTEDFVSFRICQHFDQAGSLAARHWPGPLTMVLPARRDLPPESSLSLDV